MIFEIKKVKRRHFFKFLGLVTAPKCLRLFQTSKYYSRGVHARRHTREKKTDISANFTMVFHRNQSKYRKSLTHFVSLWCQVVTEGLQIIIQLSKHCQFIVSTLALAYQNKTVKGGPYREKLCPKS